MGEGEKIGLFGGTFNPIHYGHLRSAEEIRERFGLSAITFIPASIPPHKNPEGIADAHHRLEMTRLSCKDHPCFSVSDFEIRQPGISYSINTIEHFQRETGAGTTIFFILGTDAFAEITTWMSYERLFSSCNFIVIDRPEFFRPDLDKLLPLALSNQFCYDQRRSAYEHQSGYCIFFENVTPISISSTHIRDAVRNHSSIESLVPPAVLDYIQANNLYR